MRNGWTTSRLGEVIVPTGTIDPTKSPDKKFQYVDVSGVSNETFSIEQTLEIYGSAAPSRARRQIRAGDVIFATIRPTLKRIAVVPPGLDGEVCSTAYFVFRTKPSLNPRFLFYYLFTDSFQKAMSDLQAGASYPAVNDTQVKSQKIAFPALIEQQRIVAVLDTALNGISISIANAEKSLAHTRELFQNYLNSIFTAKEGWIRKGLEDTVEKRCTLSYGIVQPGEDVIGGLPIVRPTDLKSKFIYLHGLKTIDPTLARGYKRTELSGGELLLCVRGGTGSVSIAANELAGSNVTRGIVPIRFNPKVILPEFAYFAFISNSIQKQIKTATYGAALMQINIRDVKKIYLDLPPIPTQRVLLKKIMDISSEAERLMSIYSQKVVALARLKQALLENAFSGHMTVKAAQDVQEAAK